MKRHILNLSKKASLYTSKRMMIEDKYYVLELFTYYNQSGFVHQAILSINNEEVAHAKNQYYNRTWERFTGASTYNQALNYAVASKDITNWIKEQITSKLDQSI
jgi:hypothetical protein